MDTSFFNMTCDLAEIAAFGWNFKTKEYYCSDLCRRYAFCKNGAAALVNFQGDYGSIYVEDIPRFSAFFKTLSAQNKKVSVDLRLKMNDGTFRQSRVTAVTLHDKDGKPEKTSVTIADLESEAEPNTDKAQLSAAERTFRQATAVFAFDDGKILPCSSDDGSCRLFSRKGPRNYFVSQTAIDTILPEEEPGLISALETCQKDGTALSLRYRAIATDGSSRHLKISGNCLKDGEGKTIFCCSFADITEETNLQHTCDQLLDEIPIGISVVRSDENGLQFRMISKYLANSFGHSSEEMQKVMNADAMAGILPDDAAQYCAVLDQARAVPGTYDTSYRAVMTDGTIHWFAARIHSTAETDGSCTLYNVYVDVDKQKDTELKLQESQQVLREAIANSETRYFTYYPVLHRCEIFEQTRQVHNLPSQMDDYPQSFISQTRLSPEDAEALRTMTGAIDGGEKSAECVIRINYDGVARWEKLHMTSIRNQQGIITKALGYSMDITKQKEAEKRLEAEKIHLKSLEGHILESFSFNISRNDNTNLSYSGGIAYDQPISEETKKQINALVPMDESERQKPWQILTAAAAQIPDEKERRLFVETCSRKGMKELYNKGRQETVICYRRRVGDHLLWVSTTAEVLPDPATGDLIAFFYTRDINDRMVYRQIIDAVMNRDYEFVLYCSARTGKITLCSSGSNQNIDINETTYAEAIEKTVLYIRPEDQQKFREEHALGAIIARLEKEPLCTLYDILNKEDSSLPSHPQVRLKTDAFYLDEQKDTIVFLISDVTKIFDHERENREKLTEALQSAEQASVAKTEFLSRMSHEIRTPMNAIIGLDAIALQEKNLTISMEDHLRKIGISARFLLSLINDILDMSRIESGRMMLKNERFNFEDFINGINTILYEQCRDCGLDYDCVIKSLTEKTYIGDATKLQQVLVNILGNAVKFTSPGGKVHFMVEQLSCGKERAKMRFSVADTGIGIDEKFIPHLFEPFSQENRGRTSAYGGTGLGLAICRNIVTLMDGQISVRSIKNVGSEFTVDVELGLSRESIEERQMSTNLRLRSLDTLVVDDDVVICQHTQMVLQHAGFKAEWVDSGSGAVERVHDRHQQQKDFDLILLDWKMPDMDGIATAREIRKIVGPEVTIIIMTAYDWTDIEEQAKTAGVDMFMKKPVFSSSVLEVFEQIFLRRNKKTEPEKAEGEFDFSGKRVLLVEDNEINTEIAKSLMELKHLQVDTAKNGVEALEAFTTTPVGYYDAILMDIRMPVMDGLEATRTIRVLKKADSKTIPIIAMTANAFQEDVNQSLETGMNAHLAKPIEPPLLYETLARFIGTTH